MALITCDCFSEVLGLSISINVILPQETKGQIGMQGKASGGKHPTLYLLHGMSDDHTIWQRRTSIERYVANMGLAVVMPAVHRSFYVDMKHGLNFFTFVSKELPDICRSFFNLSDQREDNFIAGLSMGGYGAFRIALACPENYAAAASMSGALDRSSKIESAEGDLRRSFMDAFGDPSKIRGSDNDLLHLASQLAESGKPVPALYMTCGTEDFLIEDQRTFKRHIDSLGWDAVCEERPGTHEWGYWDTSIQDILKWLPLK